MGTSVKRAGERGRRLRVATRVSLWGQDVVKSPPLPFTGHLSASRASVKEAEPWPSLQTEHAAARRGPRLPASDDAGLGLKPRREGPPCLGNILKTPQA